MRVETIRAVVGLVTDVFVSEGSDPIRPQAFLLDDQWFLSRLGPMTKKDIVRTISEEVGLTQEMTKVIVQKTFDAIIETLIRERRIELRNFGVFEVKSRAERKARNPKTGQEVIVPERCVVAFKPGKVMEAEIAKLQHDAETTRSRTISATNDRAGDAGPSGHWDLG